MNKVILPALSLALLFPAALFAEPLTVCIFQTAPASPNQLSPGQPSSNPDQSAPDRPSNDQSDAATLATMLAVAAGPNALTAVPVAGITSKDMDAEAQKRGCAWIVELQRAQTVSATPSFDRSPSGGASGGPLFGSSRIEKSAHIDFSLRKPGSKKITGHGASSKPDWAAVFPAEILRKIAAAQ